MPGLERKLAVLLGHIVADPFRPSPMTRRSAWALCLSYLAYVGRWLASRTWSDYLDDRRQCSVRRHGGFRLLSRRRRLHHPWRPPGVPRVGPSLARETGAAARDRGDGAQTVSPPVMRPFTLAVLTAIAACTASARGTTAVPAVSTTAGTDESAKLETRTIRATSNPILADGRDYTADPAPLVANGQLYIITGRDTAGPGVNDFKMPEWQMLVTSTDPTAGRWTHYPHLLRPEQVFKWAAPGRAYAAQIVQGPSGKFYLYAPVVYAAATTRDKFAIGVAVADSPLGRGSMRTRRVRSFRSRIRRERHPEHRPDVSSMTMGASFSIGERSAA